jgi:hypothetical protein
LSPALLLAPLLACASESMSEDERLAEEVAAAAGGAAAAAAAATRLARGSGCEKKRLSADLSTLEELVGTAAAAPACAVRIHRFSSEAAGALCTDPESCRSRSEKERAAAAGAAAAEGDPEEAAAAAAAMKLGLEATAGVEGTSGVRLLLMLLDWLALLRCWPLHSALLLWSPALLCGWIMSSAALLSSSRSWLAPLSPLRRMMLSPSSLCLSMGGGWWRVENAT